MNLRLILSLFTLVFILISAPTYARPTAYNCPTGHNIQHAFSSGSEWNLCWQERQQEGIVFNNIRFSTPGRNPRQILSEASLSQIQTDFDNAAEQIFWVTDYGLGAQSLVDLSLNECPLGERIMSNGKAILCKTVNKMGYIWKYSTGQSQGDYLDLFSISKIGSTSFVVRWKFYENGIIQPTIGTTGKINHFDTDSRYGWPVTSNNTIAVSYQNHYFWRLDFDLEQTHANDVVEQIESIPSSDKLKKARQITTIQTETARSLDHNRKRFWRVRDGTQQNANIGFVSYELVLLNHALQGEGNSNEPWLSHDFFVTQYKSCERFAVRNPTQNGCADHVQNFVNGQSIAQQDIVTWYRASDHHVPSDEDIHQVSLKWTGLQLLPRDWSSRNPF